MQKLLRLCAVVILLGIMSVGCASLSVGKRTVKHHNGGTKVDKKVSEISKNLDAMEQQAANMEGRISTLEVLTQ